MASQSQLEQSTSTQHICAKKVQGTSSFKLVDSNATMPCYIMRTIYTVIHIISYNHPPSTPRPSSES